jgi:hypothetical protein
MKPHRLLSALLLPTLLALAAPAAPAAAAGPPVAASGAVVTTFFEQSNVRTAGAVTRFDFTQHDTLTGTFEGTTVITGACVVQATGAGECHARETFTGTVNGVAGTVDFVVVIRLAAPPSPATGRFVVVGGSGGLANLHGMGTFEGTGGTGTYAGQLVFAP